MRGVASPILDHGTSERVCDHALCAGLYGRTPARVATRLVASVGNGECAIAVVGLTLSRDPAQSYARESLLAKHIKRASDGEFDWMVDPDEGLSASYTI